MKLFVVFAAVLALATGASWTLEELSAALQNPNTNPEYIPYLEDALNQLMNDIYAGKPVESISVIKPTVTHWTLDKLSSALQDPNTDPALVPYLEYALNQMMAALYNGQDLESFPVVVPVGLKPVQVVPGVPAPNPVITVPINPAPALPAPELPAPELPVPELPVPELPAPEVPAPAASSPLVQIIINVNHHQQIAETTPVHVVDEADNISVNPVDVIAVQPPTPETAPPPVDVIAVLPTPEVAPPPVDVIAVLPSPEVGPQPVDVIAVHPIEQV